MITLLVRVADLLSTAPLIIISDEAYERKKQRTTEYYWTHREAILLKRKVRYRIERLKQKGISPDIESKAKQQPRTSSDDNQTSQDLSTVQNSELQTCKQCGNTYTTTGTIISGHNSPQHKPQDQNDDEGDECA